jgi:hypothetical protein
MPNSKQDKFVGFCAVTPNRKFFKLFQRAKVRNILISYHYIRKDPALTLEILKYVKANNGLFMTDSGVFRSWATKILTPKTSTGGRTWRSTLIGCTGTASMCFLPATLIWMWFSAMSR